MWCYQTKKEGQIKSLPLFEVRSEVCYEGLRRKDSCNSRRSSVFECLRPAFFLLLKIWPGGGSSFRTRASPSGILLVFVFDTALNGVSSLPGLRYLLPCRCG